MAIDLSNIIFSEQDDVVPLSGTEEIVNTGIANALGGNDVITGSSEWEPGFFNTGIFNTDDGNDIITGINTRFSFGIINSFDTILGTGQGNDTITSIGFILNGGRIDTGNAEDSIISQGTFINRGEVFLGDGNDLFTANVDILTGAYGIENYTIIDTGEGNDMITTTGGSIRNINFIGTGGGNDIITSTSFISNEGVIETGNGADSIISHGSISNLGGVFLGEGNDSITADTHVLGHTLVNLNAMETGEGDDIITITGTIYNEGVINTGNGNDFIIAEGATNINGIYNNGGAINMGDGNDSIIANDGFGSGSNSSGAWFLGEGDDYIKGYGSGDFYGGDGNDTLELTPGTYTVGIWGEGGESPIFTKGDQLMISSEFEKLKAGSTIYDFTTLTAGQIIVVA
jgi:hypothetical protein